MDALDRQIVTSLSADARRSYTQIAKDLGVATSTVHGRVSRLLQQGLIRGFHLDLDWDSLGLPLTAAIFIRSRSQRTLPDIAGAVTANPYVVNCSAITGEFDLFATVRARNANHLGEIIDDMRVRADADTETVLILHEFTAFTHPPLDGHHPDGDGPNGKPQDGKRSAR